MMDQRPYLLLFGTWFLLVAGCSELNMDHPQAVMERCEVCHGMPPQDSGIGMEIHFNHIIDTNQNRKMKCWQCHLNNDSITGWTHDSLHRNGRVDLDTNAFQCRLCHKYKNCNNSLCHQSPPNDARNPLSQRVHALHVSGKKFACDSCHQGYDLKTKTLPITHTKNGPVTTHDNGDTNVVFGIKKHTDFAPSYDHIGKKCNNIYCHGADLIGGKPSVAIADQIKQDSTRCDFCHNTDSLRVHGHHSLENHLTLFPECLNCHQGYDLTRFITNDSTHINGVLNRIPCMKCNECHSEPHDCVDP